MSMLWNRSFKKVLQNIAEADKHFVVKMHTIHRLVGHCQVLPSTQHISETFFPANHSESY